jgi:type IV secretion system protein VirD4
MCVPVIWISLLIAQSLGGGLPGFAEKFSVTIQNPFDIVWTEYSLKTIIICSAAYFVSMAVYYTTSRNTRDGEERGSARWVSPASVNAMFRQKQNIILTKHVRLGMDTHKHKRNLNILVIGGSGAAKTRGFALPSILSANSNYLITDPKMEMLTATGNLLKAKGYDIRVLNLVNMDQSDGYNAFHYLTDETSVLRMANTVITATTSKNAHDSDPFWTKAESALLQALVFYLLYEAPEHERNFSMIMRMLEFAEIKEEDEEFISALDMLFESLEHETGPDHLAVKMYKVFRQAAGKTAKSIVVSLAVRLAPFNIPQIRELTKHDEMGLDTLGEGKVALFAVVPDNHTTYNFIVSLLFQQAIQTLYYRADQIYGGSLPRHVRFICDEFPSFKLEGYCTWLATMRSRNISASTVIQNIAQIKELYKYSWETIPGNSDSVLFLGGNETETHKWISTSLGASSIMTKTHGQSHGRSGSYSTNFQITKRELLTPDEVRMLDNRYAILLIRGSFPVLDEKYDLMKHPNIHYTTMGGAPPYAHHKEAYYGNRLVKINNTNPTEQKGVIPT